MISKRTSLVMSGQTRVWWNSFKKDFIKIGLFIFVAITIATALDTGKIDWYYSALAGSFFGLYIALFKNYHIIKIKNPVN